MDSFVRGPCIDKFPILPRASQEYGINKRPTLTQGFPLISSIILDHRALELLVPKMTDKF